MASRRRIWALRSLDTVWVPGQVNKRAANVHNYAGPVNRYLRQPGTVSGGLADARGSCGIDPPADVGEGDRERTMLCCKPVANGRTGFATGESS